MAAERGAVPGAIVEVKGLSADGFQQSYSRGRVLNTFGDNGIYVHRCDIEHLDFEDVDGGQLREVFPVRSRRLRPAPPEGCQLQSLDEYEVGQAVDYLEADMWWHGVVWTQSPGTLQIYLAEVDRTMKVVTQPELVRLSMEFVAGEWHLRQPPVHVRKPIVVQDLVAKSAARQQTASKTAAKMHLPSVGSRKTSRVVKPRLMTVNGFQVLKVNNYDIEEGERSVFDQELNRDGGRAQGVLGEPASSSSPRPPTPPQPQQQQLRGPRQSGPAAGSERAVLPIDMARKAHNDAVRADVQAAEGRRALYMLSHLPVLQKFITPSVAARISATAAKAAGGEGQRPPPVETQPEGVTGGAMRDYQLAGLRWLVDRWDDGVNTILGDEMGLGKTLQTVAFLSYLKNERGVKGPSLVVAPLSVLSSWCTELARWAPHLRVLRCHINDEAERKRFCKEVLRDPNGFDVAVTTYDMMLAHGLGSALSHNITWRVLVLDEGHKIKNEHTSIAHAMRHISRQHTVLLTGTPMQNNLHELYALLSYLHPETFTNSAPFDDAFDLTHHKVDNEVLEAAHLLMRPLCLRRLKEEVETTLPPRVETRITCPLSDMQTFWYRRLLLKDSKLLIKLEKEDQTVQHEKDGGEWKKLQSLMIQLRKCCNHPYLFEGAEQHFDGVNTGEDIVEAAGKMGVLDRLLDGLQGRGHRVVLFSQFTRMLDIIQDFLIMRGYSHLRLDGGTNRVQRMTDIAQFQAPGSEIFIYILSTRAGGLGVNLQTADTAILYDSDWNPQWDLQAMARVHRIGQMKPVHVYRFCTTGTVEERVQLRAEKKLFLDQMVNRGGLAGNNDMESLSKKELLSMLQFGADRIFKTDGGRLPTDAELDAIIDRTERQAAVKAEGADNSVRADVNGALPNGKHANGTAAVLVSHSCKHSAADFDAEAVPLSSFILNGQDYSKERSMKDIADEYWVGKQRERKQRLVQVGEHHVLKNNMYDLQQGEPSVFGRETGLAGMAEPTGRRTKRQIAGVDYDNCDTCQVCWDGGDLVCCSDCPASYHAPCLGLSLQDLEAFNRWACPHHSCAVCHRKTQAAGGLLFRCEVCANAFCEDHLPDDSHLTVHCKRFQALGQVHPKQACFVHCSPQCRELAARIAGDQDDKTAVKAEPLGAARTAAAERPAAPAPQRHAAGAPARANGNAKGIVKCEHSAAAPLARGAAIGAAKGAPNGSTTLSSPVRRRAKAAAEAVAAPIPVKLGGAHDKRLAAAAAAAAPILAQLAANGQILARAATPGTPGKRKAPVGAVAAVVAASPYSKRRNSGVGTRSSPGGSYSGAG